MTEAVKLSFTLESSRDEDATLVVLYNPQILSGALLSQVLRFGLVGATAQNPRLSGKLKGSRKALIEMIQTYGLGVEIVPAA